MRKERAEGFSRILVRRRLGFLPSRPIAHITRTRESCSNLITQYIEDLFMLPEYDMRMPTLFATSRDDPALEKNT